MRFARRVSVLLFILGLSACSGTGGDDAGVGFDAGSRDAGDRDAGSGDSGRDDSGSSDSGNLDSSSPDAGTDAIRILTINLWNRVLNGDWDARRAMVVAGIASLQPDVVCVQESVSTSGGTFDGEVIAMESGYEVRHVTTTSVPFSFDEGIAALSRWPIRATDSMELPITDLTFARRHIMSVDVERPDGILRVFCSHMSISADEDDKGGEAARAWEFIDAGRSANTAFFAGDLNAQPDGLAMRVLRGDASHSGVTGDLIDAWTTAHPTDPGLTHPSDGPDKRIDYVYAVPPTSGASAAVLDCERVFTEAVGGVYASDHLGVLCSFSPP